MNTVLENLGLLLLILVVVAVPQIVVIRRYVNNVADPLVYFVLTAAFSFSLGTVVVDDPWLLTRIAIYFVAFYLGFRLAPNTIRPGGPARTTGLDARRFRIVVVACCLVYLFANIVIWSRTGFILFSDNPSEQKGAAYADGLGFIRRVNWGIGTFALVATLYWWLWERSAQATAFLLVTVAISLTGGSKGALLPAIFALGLYFARPFAPVNHRTKVPGQRKVFGFALAFALIPAFIVLITEKGASDAANALLVRLFFSGDVLLYWGQDNLRAHFGAISGPMAYFFDSFGSILGMLRLTDYSDPLGNQFVQYSVPAGADVSSFFGPNVTFYVRGELYFGPWLAPFHALAVGWIYGLVRGRFMSYQGSDLLTYSVLSFAVILSGSLPIEEGLAISQVFDFLLLYIPIRAISSIFMLRRPMHDSAASAASARAGSS